MKRFSLSTLAVAGLLLTACADKDVIAEGSGQGEILSDGYVALNINLPTSSLSSTRADNDVFDDGETDGNEYKVTDCALLFFEQKQTPGADYAELLLAVPVTEFDETPDEDDDNITSSYKVTVALSDHDKSKELYALAVLNYTNVITITNGAAKINNSASTPITKLSDLYNEITNIDLTKKGDDPYFFMTNAVLSTKPGGADQPSGDVFQLAELEKDKIYTKKEDAQNNPAGEILVERAVAKATLKISEDAKNIQIDGKNPIEISKVEWVIDNIEPTTYVARNPGTYNSYIKYKSNNSSVVRPYRFVSHTSTRNETFLGSANDYYRTYWCEDPNYGEDATLNGYTLNPIQASANFSTCYEKNIETSNLPLYCYENTFDVAQQTYQNTTRAILKATINGGNTFYTINNPQSYYTETDFKDYIAKYVFGNKVVQDVIKQNYSGTSEELTFEDLGGTHITINGSSASTTGVYTISTLALSETGESYFGTTNNYKDDAVTAINTALGQTIAYITANLSILEYEDGVMYYEARFTHFGEELTPWGKWETANKPSAGNSVEAAYPGSTKTGDDLTRARENYLGRYGMVRNNWYDVTVDAFKKIGSPVIPPVTNDPTPDDHLDDYISVRIHVLSWAKRTQGWTFE